SRTCGGMPSPWSMISSTATPRALSPYVAISIGVPSGVNRIALPIRFVSTWRSLSSSAITTGRAVPVRIGARMSSLSRAARRARQRREDAALELAGLVEAGEREQVGHERAEADRLPLDAVHRGRDVLPGLQGAHPVELGVAAHRHERRAQLVAGVADEPPHLV